MQNKRVTSTRQIKLALWNKSALNRYLPIESAYINHQNELNRAFEVVAQKINIMINLIYPRFTKTDHAWKKTFNEAIQFLMALCSHHSSSPNGNFDDFLKKIMSSPTLVIKDIYPDTKAVNELYQFHCRNKVSILMLFVYQFKRLTQLTNNIEERFRIPKAIIPIPPDNQDALDIRHYENLLTAVSKDYTQSLIEHYFRATMSAMEEESKQFTLQETGYKKLPNKIYELFILYGNHIKKENSLQNEKSEENKHKNIARSILADTKIMLNTLKNASRHIKLNRCDDVWFSKNIADMKPIFEKKIQILRELVEYYTAYSNTNNAPKLLKPLQERTIKLTKVYTEAKIVFSDFEKRYNESNYKLMLHNTRISSLIINNSKSETNDELNTKRFTKI